MAESIADQMIDFVTNMQIAANAAKKPIKDPAILRAMDETFIEARRIRDAAFAAQDQGKKGEFHGIMESAVTGEVLLVDETLYFGYAFQTDVVIDMHVLLSKHVTPSTEAELFSEPTMDLGLLKSVLGPQKYHVGLLSNSDWNQYRTVALYSAPLKRVIGYAQIRGNPRRDAATDAADSSSSQ
jgi:hypothetical protein